MSVAAAELQRLASSQVQNSHTLCVQGDTPEQVARDALGRHPTGHSQKVFNVFFQHRQTARRRSSSKYKQQRADELTQIKAQVNEKIKALQAMRKAQLMTALCCLQLPAPHKPRLPQPLVQ